MSGFLGDPTYTQPAVGQGEAQVLRPTKPLDWQNLFANLKRNQLLDKHEREQNAALLTDDMKGEWATDNLNYIEPRQKALREKTMKLYREQNGKLTPIQKAEIQNERNSMKSYVTINNTLRDNYVDKVKKLDADKGKEYDWDNSVKMLQTWNNPKIVPEFKEDIEKNYGNDINKWRAANEHNFQLIPAYNFEKHMSDVVKDEKVSDFTENDPKTGRPKEYKFSNGRTYINTGQKFTQPQVEGLTNSVWNDNNFKSKKTKEHALDFVSKNLSVTQSGQVAYPSDLTEGQRVLAEKTVKFAGCLKGLDKEETQRALAKGYISAVIDEKGNRGVKPLTVAEASKGAGSGANKETTTIANHYNNIAQRVQQNPNLSPQQIAQEFGGTVRVNQKTGDYQIDLPVPPTVKPYVTIPAAAILIPQKGKFGETAAYHPNGKNAKGQIAGTVGGSAIMWKKDGETVPANTPGSVAYGQITYNPVLVDVNDDEDVQLSYDAMKSANPSTNITKEVHKQMLEKAKDIGNSFKVEYDLTDPVQRSFYDAIMGNPVSQTGFNKEVKASGGAAAKPHAPAKTKETASQRAARIARGG